MFDIKPDSLNLVLITDDEQRLEEDQEDDSEGPQPTPFNPLIFWPAAICDMTATSIQYIALTLTYASSFQMLRGKTKHLFFACVFYQLCGFIFPIILLHASAGGRSEKLRGGGGQVVIVVIQGIKRKSFAYISVKYCTETPCKPQFRWF